MANDLPGAVPFSVTLAGTVEEVKLFIDAMEAFLPGLVSYNQGRSRGAHAGPVSGQGVVVLQFWRGATAAPDQAALLAESDLEWSIWYDVLEYMRLRTDKQWLQGRVPVPKSRKVRQQELF